MLPSQWLLGIFLNFLWVLDKEHRWFERGWKTQFMFGVRNHHLIEEGDFATTFRGLTTRQSRKFQDVYHVTIQPRHVSPSCRQKISRPEDVSQLRYDMSRWLDLYHFSIVFPTCWCPRGPWNTLKKTIPADILYLYGLPLNVYVPSSLSWNPVVKLPRP